MPWPTVPESLLYTDLVKVRTATWGTHDKAAGRTVTYGDWSTDVYPCTVAGASAKDVTIHSRESALVTHVVTASTRLGYVRDQLQWQETDAILTIVGVEPTGDANSRAWNHYVEERQLR